MDFNHFKTWMTEAQSQFPDMRKWLGNQSDDARKDVWKTWRKALEEVSLEAATAALDKMVSDVKLQPFGGKWDTLPAIVLGLCAGASSKPHGRKDCICHGGGLVMVGVIYQAVTFDGNPLPVFEINGEKVCGPICAACLCPVGRWVNECRRKRFDSASGPKMLPDYDPKKMRMVKGHDSVFAPAIEERDRQMMAQAMLDFDGVRMDADMLDFGP